MAKVNGFKLAAKAADAKSTIPILCQVYVSAGFAVGNDLDIEIIAPCELPDGAYNVKGELVAKPADRADYQTLNTPGLAGADAAPLGDLAAMLARVESAISTEETRYYLNGVYCEFKGGLKFTAVDGHRLLHYSVPAESDSDLVPFKARREAIAPFILPRQTVKAITSIKGGRWTLKATETRFEFRDSVSGVVIRSKTIDGCFPEYTRVIPRDGFTETLTGDSKACLDVFKRVASYGAERSKSVKVNGARLFMRPPEIAPLETTWPVEVEAEGDAMEIGFNAGYVRDMLTVATLDKGARVIFRLRDPASPIRVEFPACPGLVGVVMPLRV
jgi:DNA polymerase III subunit beta